MRRDSNQALGATGDCREGAACDLVTTWIALSIGLVVFGVVDASLPIHPSQPLGLPGRTNDQPERSRGHCTVEVGNAMPLRSVPLKSQATQRPIGAERFVVATDTTDPTHPEGDASERALLRLVWVCPAN